LSTADLLTPRRRFALLLLALFSLLFGPVFLPDTVEGVLGPILFTVLLLSALAAVANTRRRMAVAATLAIPGCGLMVAAALLQERVVTAGATVAAVVFLVYAVAAILDYVFRADHVDAGVILGSLCVYLMLGVIWAELYGLIQLYRPGSLRLPEADVIAGSRGLLQYFSFVTITTVGYGDVYPVSPLARATAATEALLGQLYLVVLVARLVGLHTAQETRRQAGG